MPDLRGEHEHVRTRIRFFQDEYRNTPAPERRRELQQEMLHAARESAELVRRIEAARLLSLVAASGAGAVEARYAIEAAIPDRREGVLVATYTDGPRAKNGTVLTVAGLAAEGDPIRTCAAKLAAQLREMELMRSERRRTLIEAHGRDRADAIRAEMQAFLKEFQELYGNR